jgi:hypothetical protein
VVEEATLDRCQLIEVAPQLRKDARERASLSPANLFSSPGTDVAQRLIVLSLTGLVDELTLAGY